MGPRPHLGRPRVQGPGSTPTFLSHRPGYHLEGGGNLAGDAGAACGQLWGIWGKRQQEGLAEAAGRAWEAGVLALQLVSEDAGCGESGTA